MVTRLDRAILECRAIRAACVLEASSLEFGHPRRILAERLTVACTARLAELMAKKLFHAWEGDSE